MQLHEVRAKYLEFFKERGHAVIPSASLVPQNDPTTLFTGSGMQPLVPYLLGKDHPEGKRLVDSQKSFRSMDIEEVGDNRHTTFFEMLGNWSLGDYFKQEQLPWFFEFLTDEIGLDPEKLYVTAFIGDPANKVPKDTEAGEIWQKLFADKNIEAKIVDIGSEEDGYVKGMQGGRIFYYDAKKNWWSRAGTPEKMPAGEPGGPDSEVFYDFGTPHDTSFGPECHPNCDCGRFLEIGNSVFMQYIKNADGTFALLPKQNVDFGGGLERIAAVSLEESDVFNIDVFDKAKEIISDFCNVTYRDKGGPNGIVVAKSGGLPSKDMRYTYRVILDHIRAATFLISDNVLPGNKDQGYFVRRLIRRAVRFGLKLGIDSSFTSEVAKSFIDTYKEAYPELLSRQESIILEFKKEEEKFRETLARGTKELARFIDDAVFTQNGILSAQGAYQLVTTFGFPLELVIEEAGERGIKQIDINGFKELLKGHQDLSRAGSEQKFKGGLADTAEQTVRLHTAHHLLLKALQIVLGPEVHQRGSNITQERLRIDFNYPQKMTDEQKREVERIVNEKIQEDIPMLRIEMDKEEAEKLGAEHEFGAKYPDRVSIYELAPKGATEENPDFAHAFSIEFCGGPHVTHTGELSKSGVFKIQKEEA
ncbi:MAG TPA: alanine--tRNA ligase, partial [Candidatus Paceibacterota bacterium]|nr:alanine--tRNA ligase [Candidatus Paceibacterota bacterium]